MNRGSPRANAAQRRAVFLDRDGVLNRPVIRNGKPYPPAHLGELEILPGVAGALERLRTAGFVLIVVTNQPDVARGTQTRESVEVMNDFLLGKLPLDEVRVCYHTDDQCPERKPNPGMLTQAAEKHDLNLTESFMVGDRWRDIEAGTRAGCRTIFIDYDYREKKPSSPDHTCACLNTAAKWILEQS